MRGFGRKWKASWQESPLLMELAIPFHTRTCFPSLTITRNALTRHYGLPKNSWDRRMSFSLTRLIWGVRILRTIHRRCLPVSSISGAETSPRGSLTSATTPNSMWMKTACSGAWRPSWASAASEEAEGGLPIVTLSLKNNKKGHVFKRVTLFLYALVTGLFLTLGELRVRSVIRPVHQGINPYTDPIP